MARYRVVFQIGQHVMGGSEAYYTGDVAIGAATAQIQALLDKRNGCLYDTVYWQGVRISVADSRRRSVFSPPGVFTPLVAGQFLTVPERGNLETTAIVNRPDQWRSCLQVRLSYSDDRATSRYFLGPADGVIKDEPGSWKPDGNVAWTGKFEAFRLEVGSGRWYIRARKNTGAFLPKPVHSWFTRPGADPLLGFVLPAAPAPGFDDGERITIQGTRRKPPSKQSYNGQYFVEGTDTTTKPGKAIVYLQGTAEGVGTSVKIPGTAQKIGHDYFTIQGFQPLRATRHDRGRPSSAPRGRRSIRLSLDP